MKGAPAIYLGKIVDKNKFRAYVYGAKGEKRLVESWAEFELAMESGIWFATLDDVIALNIDIKPKLKSKAKSKKKQKIEDSDEKMDELEDEGSVFEVKNDLLFNENK